MSFYLYLAQRVSALVMAPLVMLHLGVIIYAINNGIDAQEILGRTRGNVFWGIVYTLFVMAVSIHASIGLRTVLQEWTSLKQTALNTIFRIKTIHSALIRVE